MELASLKRQKDEAESGLTVCKNSRQFGCALDTEACRQLSTTHDLCVQSLKAKNISFQTLQDAHEELVDDWENVTATLDQCNDDSVKMVGELKTASALVVELRRQVADQQEDHDRKLQTCEDKAESLQIVVESVQDDLKCLDQSKNCSFEAGKYWCLPRFFTNSLCLMEAQTGQEVFGVSICGLLGDRTMGSLNWGQFVKNNPLVATFLIFLMIFATIGFVCTAVIITWCVVRCRRRKRSSSFTLKRDATADSKVIDFMKFYLPGTLIVYHLDFSLIFFFNLDFLGYNK